jgi:hypothetical protein
MSRSRSCALRGTTTCARVKTSSSRATERRPCPSTDAVSRTTALRLVNNLFYLSNRTPTKLIEMAAADSTGFEQTSNLFFFVGGAVSAITSDVTPGGVRTLIDKDPKLVDPAKANFRLTDDGPAALAATPLSEVKYDAAGKCRVGWNIGAY